MGWGEYGRERQHSLVACLSFVPSMHQKVSRRSS